MATYLAHSLENGGVNPQAKFRLKVSTSTSETKYLKKIYFIDVKGVDFIFFAVRRPTSEVAMLLSLSKGKFYVSKLVTSKEVNSNFAYVLCITCSMVISL